MPCRYVIDKGRKLVINVAWDRLTFSEMRAIQNELASDPNFDPAFNQLVDLTALTVLDLSIAEARRIAERGLYLPTSRRAVIASSPATYGMGRMMDAYHSMATGRENISVFYDKDSALQWLGLDSLPPYDGPANNGAKG